MYTLKLSDAEDKRTTEEILNDIHSVATHLSYFEWSVVHEGLVELHRRYCENKEGERKNG